MDRSRTNPPASLPYAAVLAAVALCSVFTACAPRQAARPAAPPPAPPAPAAAQPVEAATPPAPDLADTFFPHRAGSTWSMAATAGQDKWKLTLKAASDTTPEIAAAPASPGTTSPPSQGTAGAAPPASPDAPGAATPPDPAVPAAPRTWIVETRRDGEPAQVERYRADDTGVYLVGFGPDGLGRIEPPMPLLKAPFAPGAAWKWQGVFVDAGVSTPGEAEFTLKGPEPLTVPAGRYVEAYVVEQRFRLGSPQESTLRLSKQWLVPGVGLVQQQTVDDTLSMTARLLDYKQAPAKPR